MRWIRSGLQGLSGWLGSMPSPVAASGEQLEAIREAMLVTLGDVGAAEQPGLAARIRFCREADTLWALLSELLDANAQLYGDFHARKRVARVAALFDGLRPQSPYSQRIRAQTRTAPWRLH